MKLSSEAMKLYGVRVEPAARRRLVETISAPARVAFNTETTAHVGTPVEGRVAEIRARLGDAVRAGDALLVIDSPTLGEAQSDFLRKRAEAGVARAALEVAESAFLRAKELAAEKGVSKRELLRREGEFKGAAGARVAAEAAAVAAENKLHLYGMTNADVRALARTGEIRPRYEVRTPVAGIVVEREATLGEIVGPERERLFVVADPSVLWVLADVPEKRAAMVRVGASARVETPSSAESALVGSVSFIAPALSSETRTLEARIVVPGGEAGLRPGMYAQAEIDSLGPDGEAPEALAVPETAVVTA
ncbi:MAG: efflux RND transporter periplasmic adaptor subunit, partial [Candidatus Methylomirabilis sp.]|nr:efflux RND transporter periplasmic adaptor subunit [Deltaproteobacteria bacterium]